MDREGKAPSVSGNHEQYEGGLDEGGLEGALISGFPEAPKTIIKKRGISELNRFAPSDYLECSRSLHWVYEYRCTR